MSGRMEARFAALKKEGRAALVTFTMAYDPDKKISQQVLEALPGAGADIIELGMPFSDPMADGPAIQAAGLRALKAGAKMKHTLQMVSTFRKKDKETPVILMGYYNPVQYYGVEKFTKDAAKAGVDGLIIVDVPPEEDKELYAASTKQGLSFIRLATPTSDDARLKKITAHAGGFLYYVSVTGVTGTRSAKATDVGAAIARIRKHTDLPVAAGFGIKTPEAAAKAACYADAVVVGSALVEQFAKARTAEEGAKNLLSLVSEIAKALRKSTR